MLKTSFSKYLTAFILVILISFCILAGIVTYMVNDYALGETEKRLNKECNIVVRLIEAGGVGNVEDEIISIAPAIEPMVNLYSDYDVIITNAEGKILLSTFHGGDENGMAVINTQEGLGHINVSAFLKQSSDGGYVFSGHIGGTLNDKFMVYARQIMREDKVECYALALTSINRETDFVRNTRNVVINSSLLVMLLAVIVTYIVTNRIVKPLKKMTATVKKYAKGDFSSRVPVEKHNDEIAELGLAFNNMADSLDSLEKMRNSFLANVSHDLRTPMTTISGFIDGINSGAIPPEKHEYYLGIISAEIHRLSRLVSQLLDISRLESGERKFTYSNFDIAEVARIILISFEQKIDDKQLDVEFSSEFDCMYANADKDAIYQVLYNLCHNAIKFSSEKGKLKITISKITDTKLKVAVYNQGQSLSRDDEKMVFDRFYKSDQSRGLDKSGVGLGLYICKTIIDAHGETIGVESTEGDGCEFWFTVTEGVQSPKRKMQQLDIPKID